jgi:hypothetical protein
VPVAGILGKWQPELNFASGRLETSFGDAFRGGAELDSDLNRNGVSHADPKSLECNKKQLAANECDELLSF